ncbi:MAG: hypothetical protein DRH15_10410 [Deltaproteobacteria bacterium]|nr:hypothetical protein [Deltaproteobacteria bacterium]RLB78131.1 MAG: hypothetical protein DRH15_10410 [Deltaproteobacteria bacterium]
MKRFLQTLSVIILQTFLTCTALAIDAQTLVEKSFAYLRGKASVSLVQMTIHRPRWERKRIIKARTKGLKQSLFYIVSPPKDRGNGTFRAELKATEDW